MIIRVIAVGKLKERYWQEGVAEYARRLRPYARLEIEEVPEARLNDDASSAKTKKAMAVEGEAILGCLRQSGLVVALERQGRAMDSLELAGWLERQVLDGKKEIAWVIGGSQGLAPSVMKRAGLVLSLSTLTFPHQMVRLILLEQIYRCFRIIYGEPYHR
jgi:23S rRNA (pseudouridine1915-N3)-methyltransferase